MRKMFAVFICVAIVFSLSACKNNVTFTEGENKTILAKDGTEYTMIGYEGGFWCLGEWDFIGHVKGEKKTFVHLTNRIKTGMYSVNGSKDVLVRYFPDNEFAAMYVKADLLKKEITLENCVRFEFIKGSLSNKVPIFNSGKGITECEQFLDDIKSGEKAKDAGLYDLVKQPDGMLKNCYVYGYVCGIVQEDINIVIPLEIMSFDDQAYSIRIDDIEYVLSEDWLEKLITE